MKQFKLTITETDKGDLVIESCNEGFNALEIAAILEMKKLDVYSQMEAEVNHRRTSIIGGKKYAIVESEEKS